MNRSIQAEGSFANIKGDMNFRCYLCKGKKNVLAESMLLAMAHNINKLHHKIQKGTTGTYLFELKNKYKFKILKNITSKNTILSRLY